MAWIKTKIKIKKAYKPQAREAIGQDIIDHIIERSKSGKDKSGNPFPAYSKNYIKSKDFKIAGKSKSKVNLTLSDEMLNGLILLGHKKGEITVGYEKDDDRNNSVAEGNIKGTYGQPSPIRGKKRDFLGIQASAKKEISEKYPVRSKKKLTEAVADFIGARTGAQTITKPGGDN